jgi:hypothetical protein
MRSLGKLPGDRFPSAASMATALADARMGRDPGAPSGALTVSLPLSEPPPPGLPPGGLPLGGGPLTAGLPELGPGRQPATGPSAITTALPVAAPEPRWAGSFAAERAGRGLQAGVEEHTPPMPWARVPGDATTGGAGPGGRLGRLARRGEPGQRRSRRAIWLLGLALGLVVLLALPIVISWQGGRAGAPQPAATAPPAGSLDGGGVSLASSQVRVPDLRGARLGVATARLRALGLEVVVSRGGGRRGVVVSMSPGPDSVVDRGSRVVLVGGRPDTGKGRDRGKEDN